MLHGAALVNRIAGKGERFMRESTDKTNDNSNTAKDGKQSGNRLVRLLTSEGMRYLFIGGCTTLVNLVVFTVLCRIVHLEVNISNIISVSVSILFAYVTNKLIVFRSHCSSIGELAAECARFIGARLATMVMHQSTTRVFLTTSRQRLYSHAP